MKRKTFVAALLTVLLSWSNASANVWIELLRANCWIDNVDCFNDDFNGDPARTVLTIKAFQAWEYGTFFLYYDITEPFKHAGESVLLNEKAGFFGGISTTLSVKKVAEKIAGSEFDWGFLTDLSLRYEVEHVSKFGALHYIGLQYDLQVPYFDFLSLTSVAREDRSLSGIDLQVGAAWQNSFSLGALDFLFTGFMQWGVFGEGDGQQFIVVEQPVGDNGGILSVDASGNSFFITQPQLLWDLGKVIQFTPAKLYIGFEYQLALNRYLIPDKNENVLQAMVRWNI